jgi:hypothetical protein
MGTLFSDGAADVVPVFPEATAVDVEENAARERPSPAADFGLL